MFQRVHLQTLISRFQEPRRFLQVLVGPRQTGKTTLATQLVGVLDLPYRFVSADAVAAADQLWLDLQWESCRILMDQQGAASFLLVIDEIQKIGDWSEWVKKNWDRDTREKRDIRVLLLGSSRLLLQQGLTESLAGRYELHFVGHWRFAEMREAFSWNLQQYIWFGGYPGSAALINDENRWKQYVRDALIETSISKDILMMTRVDKPALMRRVFELGCHYAGQILSYTKMIGQLQDAGNTTTLSNYLELLNTAGLLGGLEKFSPDMARQRASSPKFQVHNTALISAQSVLSFRDATADPETWGRMVESTVGAHLMQGFAQQQYQLYYWRERSDEVDFVLKRGEQLVVVEVKTGTETKTRGMQVFKDRYAPAKMLLVGSGGIPVEQFLLLDPAALFDPTQG